MVLPISLGEVVSIVNKAIELYGKIEAAPKQINDVGIRMKRLKSYLHNLDDLLKLSSKYGLAAKRPSLIGDIRDIVQDCKVDAEKVKAVLERWDQNIGPGGLELRFDWFAQWLFALGSSPKKLEELTSSIDRHLSDIDHQILLLNAFGQDEQLKRQVQNKQNRDRTTHRPLRQLRSDYGIIFVDPLNVGRSKIGEGYAKLLRGWTNTAGQDRFRIKFAHSAGLKLINKCDCVDIVKEIVKTDLEAGDRAPTKFAMASLFDNKLINYPFKADVKKNMLASRSRGVSKSLFSTYDYILVFDRRYEGMLKQLKWAFEKSYGLEAVPKDRGKIVMLGEYANTADGDIVSPVDRGVAGVNDEEKRKRWNETTAIIKLAFKKWLTEELDWTKPTQS